MQRTLDVLNHLAVACDGWHIACCHRAGMRHRSTVVPSRDVAMVVTLLASVSVKSSAISGVQRRSGDQTAAFDTGVAAAMQRYSSNGASRQGRSLRFAMWCEMRLAVRDRDVVVIRRSQDETKAARRCLGGLVAEQQYKCRDPPR